MVTAAMRRGWLIWHMWALWAGYGLALSMDVTLDQKDAGFFLKPLFRGQQDDEQPGLSRRHLVVTRPKGAVKLKANYGMFSAEDTITPSLLQDSLGNQSSILNNIVVDDLDLSAHVVSRSITMERPLVQVLFHASQNRQESKGKNGKNSPSKDPSGKWCLQMHIQKEGQELTAVCVLSLKSNVCIAELTVPGEWWDTKQTQSADIFYSAYAINENLQCSSASNSIIPGKTDDSDQVKSYVSTVTLTHGQLTYQEVKEDQHILIYIPQKSFYPGSKFRVPVRLQAESDLELFVVRVKARHGIRIVGAEESNRGKWQIALDMNHKRHGAMVTAFIQNKELYTKTSYIQDVFEWIFEVEDGSDDEDPGRITMNLEYEMNTQQKEKYGSVENRVVARINVQHDNVQTIIPVIKATELMNTAILTGKIQNFPMYIYSLSQSGRATDITAQTTCHSGDEDVLKVAQACNLVYMDGSESKGSPSVSVIAKNGRHTKFLFFKVWVPEMPLDIELSDNKLSQIKGWKAPKHQRRKARGVDFGLLTHPGLLLQEEGERKEEEYTTSCHLRFQQAVVKIYARYMVPDGQRSIYMVHRKALMEVTQLVYDRLRIADTSIAMLSGDVVEGVRPGRTEIQVLSRMGRVIGAREIKVGNDKVTIERLQVDVVTGLSAMVESDSEFPGTLLVSVARKMQLQRKYAEGILDVAVEFSDKTTMQLGQIPPSDYFLHMDTLNNHVVAFGPMIAADTPRIIALGQGKGELLKLALELGDACQRKKSRPLAVSYVYIDVDFEKTTSEETEKLQNDGGSFGFNFDNNRASDRYDVSKDVDVKTDKGTLHVNIEDNMKGGKQGNSGSKGGDFADGGSQDNLSAGGVMLDERLADLAPEPGEGLNMLPNHEAQLQHVSTARGMTALEIGMYVLLGVFCLAIVVFMANCMVYVWRNHKKRLPPDNGESIHVAHDWVWIGRATLERNAINTNCSQALMPEADFNGNQNNPNLLHPREKEGTISARNSACGGGSNRNSVVSTYKGSECSIRITSNPHPDANPAPGSSGNGTLPKNANANEAVDPPANANTNANLPSTSGVGAGAGAGAGAVAGAEAGTGPNGNVNLPPVTNTNLNGNPPANMNANLNANGSLPLPPRHLPPGCPASAAAMAAAAAAAENNGNISENEWDYEAMGMTYEQLMEYFDNLKESTA